MKVIQSILVQCLLISIVSCNNINSNKEELSPSQLTMKNYLSDIKESNRSFDEVLKDYFFEYNEILNSEVYFYIYEGIHFSIKETIQDSTLNTEFYWNQEIDSIERYNWVNDNELCDESLLILIKDINSNTKNYFTYCFAKNGKIYSNMSIINPNNNAIIWLRNQEEYIKIDEESQQITIEIENEK